MISRLYNFIFHTFGFQSGVTILQLQMLCFQKIFYARKPIPGLDTHTIYRPGRLYLHSVVSRPTRLYFNLLGHKRHWFDVVSIVHSVAGHISRG